LLATAFELAHERFDLLVHDSMSSNVASLSELLAASFTRVGTLSSMSSFMRLQISELGKTLTA
jgi:hypothetical protein